MASSGEAENPKEASEPEEERAASRRSRSRSRSPAPAPASTRDRSPERSEVSHSAPPSTAGDDSANWQQPQHAPAPPQPLTDDEITHKLGQRENARRAKDYATADLIRDDLRARGLSLDDSTKMWTTTDGRKGIIGVSGEALKIDGMTPSQDELTKMLEERQEARRNKDFATSDRIRLELRARGVTVSDQTNTWTSVDGSRGTLQPPTYVAAAGGYHGQGYGAAAAGANVDVHNYSALLDEALRTGRPVDTAVINAALEDREKMRKSKDFANSDRVRDQLRSLGIRVEDSAFTWTSPDGRSGTYGAGPPAGYQPAYGQQQQQQQWAGYGHGAAQQYAQQQYPQYGAAYGQQQHGYYQQQPQGYDYSAYAQQQQQQQQQAYYGAYGAHGYPPA